MNQLARAGMQIFLHCEGDSQTKYSKKAADLACKKLRGTNRSLENPKSSPSPLTFFIGDSHVIIIIHLMLSSLGLHREIATLGSFSNQNVFLSYEVCVNYTRV